MMGVLTWVLTPGNRWDCFQERSNNTLVYSDPLGWALPNRLEGKGGSFISCIWGTDTTTTTTKYGHDPAYHASHGRCGEN